MRIRLYIDRTGKQSFFKGQNESDPFYHTLAGKSKQRHHWSASVHFDRISKLPADRTSRRRVYRITKGVSFCSRFIFVLTMVGRTKATYH